MGITNYPLPRPARSHMTKRLLPVLKNLEEDDFFTVDERPGGGGKRRKLLIDETPWLARLPNDVLSLLVNTYCSELDRIILLFTSKQLRGAVDTHRVPNPDFWVSLAAEEGSKTRVVWASLYWMKKQDREAIESNHLTNVLQSAKLSYATRLEHIFCGLKINGNIDGLSASWPDHRLLYDVYLGASKTGKVDILNAFCIANHPFLIDHYLDWYMVDLSKAGGRGHVGVLRWHVRMCALHPAIKQIQLDAATKQVRLDGNITNPWFHCYNLVKRIMKGGHLEALQYYHETRGSLCNADFELAARLGHLPIIRWLNDVGSISLNGPNLLEASAKSGNLECFQYILSKEGVNPDSRTAISACKGGNVNILKSIWDIDPTCFGGGWEGRLAFYNLEVKERLVTNALRGASIEVIQWLKEKNVFARIDQELIEEAASRLIRECRGYDMLGWLVKERYTWEYHMLSDLRYYPGESPTAHLGKILDAGVPWPTDAMSRLAKNTCCRIRELIKWARSRCLDWGPHHLCTIGFERFYPDLVEWLLSPKVYYTVSKEEFEEIDAIMVARKRKFMNWPAPADKILKSLYKRLKDEFRGTGGNSLVVM